jgi:hypothetical protein
LDGTGILYAIYLSGLLVWLVVADFGRIELTLCYTFNNKWIGIGTEETHTIDFGLCLTKLDGSRRVRANIIRLQCHAAAAPAGWHRKKIYQSDKS